MQRILQRHLVVQHIHHIVFRLHVEKNMAVGHSKISIEEQGAPMFFCEA